MVDRVEGFAEVGRRHDSAGRWFPLVEAPSYLVGQRVEGGDGGMSRGEAMLVGRAGKVGKDEGTHEALKDFRGRAEEGNGPIRDAMVGGLIGFKDGENEGRFPDSGKGRMGGGKVEEGGEVGEGKGAEVFEMDTGEAVGANSRRRLGSSDGLSSGGDGEGGEVVVEGSFVDGAVDEAGEGVGFMG